MRENRLEQTSHLPSEEDQIRFLFFVLERIKKGKNTAKVQSSQTELSDIVTKIGEHDNKIIEKINTRFHPLLNLDNDPKKLIAAIMIVNELLAHLEADNDEAIASLKEHNFYKILYHYPIFTGEEYKEYVVIEIGLNFLIVDLAIILLFAGAIYFSAPLWLTAIATGLFVGAFAYLSGILYGVVNDLFATQANLPYFLLGHQPDQKSILKTNDKIAQAIAWGIYATNALSFCAGVLFTIAITITAFFVPIATFALPLVMIAMPLVAIAVEFIIRTNPRPSPYGINCNMKDYQKNRFHFMCPTNKEKSNWLSNGKRNGIGYEIVPLIAVVALISLIVLSAVSIYLPPLLFISPIIAMAIPAVFAAVTCIALIIAGMYMHRNRDKQVDDRYRLEFGNGPQGRLCLDNQKDLGYFEMVLKDTEHKDFPLTSQGDDRYRLEFNNGP